MDTRKMSDEWRIPHAWQMEDRTLISIYKNKGNIQICSCYHKIRHISHY